MSSQVEIEFAVNLSVPIGKPKQFGVLQIRPLVINAEKEELDLTKFKDSEILCKSKKVLGNGTIRYITDIVYVDIENYNRAESRITASEIAKINLQLINENKKYLLIGVGRWGSFDPWLGIPVTWEQISGAKTIVESNFRDFNVELSQGSHFFQNLTSFNIGYFLVDNKTNDEVIDWEWLRNQQKVKQEKYTTWIKTKKPITIIINGRENNGIILKS